MLSHLVENMQMLRQVQCFLEENAKLEASSHFQAFSLLQQGVKYKDCKRRNKWSTPFPETGSISIIRGGVYSDQLEHRREGFGSRLLTCCRNVIELAAASPSRQVPWRWRPLAGKQAGGAWAVPRSHVEQHLVCIMPACSALFAAAALLGTSRSRHAGARNTPREMQALQVFRWGTAISICKSNDQNAEQMKVLSCCGTCSSPWFNAFVQLI